MVRRLSMTATAQRWIARATLPLVALLALAAATQVDASAGTVTTRRVNVSSQGSEGNEVSYRPSLSADGRLVAFDSYATNLVGGDTNTTFDVFIRDRATGATRRISVSSAGEQSNGNSYRPSISADGRFVAFESSATNLVGGDTNGFTDVFVRDRETGKTRRVSVRSDGSEANEGSDNASISADGRFVAFRSAASNLVGGDTNGYTDVFVHDRATGKTTRASVRTDGSEANGDTGNPSLSAHGRFVAYVSTASNLVGHDLNTASDIFVRDRETGKTSRVSVNSAGVEGDGYSDWPSISANGRFVAFYSDAPNLVAGDSNAYEDVFVRDREKGRTRRVSLSSAGDPGNAASSDPFISAGGRFVGFISDASNLVGGDTNLHSDIFVFDRATGRTRRASVSSDGTEANDGSSDPFISADGRFIAFSSKANNLVANDNNVVSDIFLRGPLR